MTIREVKERFKDKYADIEVYIDSFQHKAGFHTDRIQSIDDFTDSDEAIEYSLMDESEYSDSILANHSESADFDSWYGDSDAKVLVIKTTKRQKED